MPRKRYTRKRKTRKRYTRKRYSRKRYSKKRYSRKRYSKKRYSKKRYSKKRKYHRGGADVRNTPEVFIASMNLLKERAEVSFSDAKNNQTAMAILNAGQKAKDAVNAKLIYPLLWIGDAAKLQQANVSTDTVSKTRMDSVAGDYTYDFTVKTDAFPRIDGYIPYLQTQTGKSRRLNHIEHHGNHTKVVLKGTGHIKNYGDLGFNFEMLGLKVIKNKKRSRVSNYYVCYNEDHVIMCISQDPRKSYLLKRWHVFTLPDKPIDCMSKKISIEEINKQLSKFHLRRRSPASRNTDEMPFVHRCTIQQRDKLVNPGKRGKEYCKYYVVDSHSEITEKSAIAFLYYDGTGDELYTLAYGGFQIYLTVKNTDKLNKNIYAFILAILSRENPKHVSRELLEAGGKMAVAKATAGAGTVGIENLIPVDQSFSSFPASVVKEQVITSTLDASSAESNKVKASQ